MTTEQSRRDFLAFAAAVCGLAYVPRLNAQGSSRPKRFIYLQQPGAPSRFTYDLFLDPYGSPDFAPNNYLGTRYLAVGTNNFYSQVDYHLTEVHGLRLPPLWSWNLPAPNGEVTPAAQLLHHLIHIRGVNLGADGHPFCQQLHLKPLGAKQSMTALTTDNYPGAPIAMLDLETSGHTFSSLTGATRLRTGVKDELIQYIMRPFISTLSADLKNKIATYQTQINGIRGRMSSLAHDYYDQLESLEQSQDGSLSLMQQSFPDLDATWVELYSKYKDLISRTLRTTWPGINDLAIGVAAGVRDDTYRIDSLIPTMADLRSLIGTKAQMNAVAQVFATIEFSMQYDLTYSISAYTGTISELTNPNGTLAVPPDSHFTGKIPDLLFTTLGHAALHACMIELIKRLKFFGIWSDTVIEVGGEFNRSPKGNGTGSDHAFRAASVAIYTGQHHGSPIILGNIYNESPYGASARATYPGTYGEAAPIEELGKRSLNIADVAATISFLLGVPSPVTAAGSLLAKSTDGTLSSRLSPATTKRRV